MLQSPDPQTCLEVFPKTCSRNYFCRDSESQHFLFPNTPFPVSEPGDYEPNVSVSKLLRNNSKEPNSDGLQAPTSDGLQPNSDGLHPTSDGLQPK